MPSYETFERKVPYFSKVLSSPYGALFGETNNETPKNDESCTFIKIVEGRMSGRRMYRRKEFYLM